MIYGQPFSVHMAKRHSRVHDEFYEYNGELLGFGFGSWSSFYYSRFRGKEVFIDSMGDIGRLGILLSDTLILRTYALVRYGFTYDCNETSCYDQGVPDAQDLSWRARA